jgi:hypothetical protein
MPEEGEARGGIWSRPVKWDDRSRSTWIDVENLTGISSSVSSGEFQQMLDQAEQGAEAVRDIQDPSGRLRVGDRVRYGNREGRVGRYATVDGRTRIRIDWPTDPISFSWAFPSEVQANPVKPGTVAAFGEGIRRLNEAFRDPPPPLERGMFVRWPSELLGIMVRGVVIAVEEVYRRSGETIVAALVEWKDEEAARLHHAQTWIPIGELEYAGVDPSMMPVEALRAEEV